MTADEIQRLDDHLRLSDTGNRLLGLTMLCGEFGTDWITQEQIYLLALRYGTPYPEEHGRN